MPSEPIIPPDSPFTLHNIPFGVISTTSDPKPRCATALGHHAIDLSLLWKDKDDLEPNQSLYDIFSQPSLNAFAALSSKTRSQVREILIHDLSTGRVPEKCFIPLDQAHMHLPMKIWGYSDFFCSLEHAQNCAPLTGGEVARNFFYAPSVYNGRASSVIPSPTPVRRPKGIRWDHDGGQPVFGPAVQMDFELEMGYFVSKPIPIGETIKAIDAPEHIFGFVLLNDWSSRDIQAFEMTPLGPFHSKGFGTSISPWIVTLDALKPFACEPEHVHSATEFDHQRYVERATATFDIRLNASLIRNGERYNTTESNLRYLYWTPYQQLAHHASAGCGIETGDLMGTGTISGQHEGELGCLFEATKGGSRPLEFPNGTTVRYLEDGDEIVLDAWCDNGTRRIGFGECRGKLLPSL
ncbi:hypothetical protein BDV34DRAFT_195091 [Aspergillus parasiticus]|uniref:Fumarylacetoacetase n=1 Tax=Aspergillus parasiticus TaxID=5067 RepID=A0A5N6DNJ9_ASPPA|nr:hypothetical protein BDV34DRAFT_195091 [Aspergillus parasiticus]